MTYLNAEQNLRLQHMAGARLLWQGRHREFFLDHRRSQFDWPEMLVLGKVIRPYITFNVLRLISTTLTDLLLGEEPMLRIDDEVGQKELDDLKTRSNLHRVFYNAALTASWSREASVEVRRWNGQVYIQDVPPAEIFPLGMIQPDGQFGSYARYETAMVPPGNGLGSGGPGQREVTLLLQTTYFPGSIVRQCFELDGQGKVFGVGAWGAANDVGPTGLLGRGFWAGGDKRGPVSMSRWPVKNPDGSDLPDEEKTGIPVNTVIWMANEIDSERPTSDFEGLLGEQDKLNAKETQIARVLAKHGDPRLAAPEAAAGDTGSLDKSQGVFFYRSKDDIPEYITWNAELSSAIADRDFTLNALCIAAEISKGLLGIEQGAAPDSARKLRLQATKSIARAKRKSTFVKPFIRRAINTALMLSQAGLIVPMAIGNVGGGAGAEAAVDLKDGLPIDDLDQAQMIQMLTANGRAMSIPRAVRLQIDDPAAAEEEIAELQKESSAAAPTVMLGGAPMNRQPGEEGDGQVPANGDAKEQRDDGGEDEQ